jgi:hypothetical protein
MREFKSVMRTIRGVGYILLRGFIRMTYGTMTAGLFAMAIWGLVMITTETGWTAVMEFIAAICTATVATTGMYAMGGGVKKGAKK